MTVLQLQPWKMIPAGNLESRAKNIHNGSRRPDHWLLGIDTNM